MKILLDPFPSKPPMISLPH